MILLFLIGGLVFGAVGFALLEWLGDYGDGSNFYQF